MSALPRPEAPPSNLVRAAQARLVANLHARDLAATIPLVGPADPQTATPWPGPVRAPDSLRTPDGATDSERYEFGEPFAAGGLGLVRRARDRRLGRTIAVKELLRSDPAAERRFTLEAAITARLQHPGIVPLYDIGRFPTGEPYYCMKLVEGLTLEQKISACDNLPARLALLEHLIAAADAVAFAHRNNVIHRDLKPGNILVGELGETVVIDWGLAKDLSGNIADELPDLPATPVGTISTMTQHGTVLGTLRYMPPEQARGLPVDARGDVFSLGAVLHHILAGAPPHKDLDNKLLIARVSKGATQDLQTLVPDAPRELVAIARRAMAPDPADRYPSAEALAQDLRAFRTGRLVGAHRYGPREVMRLWLRRHRGVATVASSALLALAVVGGVGVQNVRHQRDLATVAQRDAESAQHTAEAALAEARARTNTALLAQARGLLQGDLAAALTTLADLDLSPGTGNDNTTREARLLTLAAESRGAPTRVLHGHIRHIAHLVTLSDGRIVSLDVGGSVWSWDPKTGEGTAILDLHQPHTELIAASDAPVFAVLAEHTAHIFRADGTREELPFPQIRRGLAKTRNYSFQLSTTGDRLAALGEPVHNHDEPRGPSAVLWDLTARPAAPTVITAERNGQTTMSPDGRAIAHDAAEGPAMLWVEGVATPMPGLGRPLGFSSDGAHVYGFPEPHQKPTKLTSYTRATGELHPLGRWVLATTRDNHALVLDFDEFVPTAILSLRSLATGEPRWTERIPDSQTLSQWGDHADFDVVLDPRGDGLALRTGDEWQLANQHDPKHRHHLEIGLHRRAQFLPDGGFTVAHNADLWVWDTIPTTNQVLPPNTTVVAIADDSPLAVASPPDNAMPPGLEPPAPTTPAPDPFLIDLSSGTVTDSACLTDQTHATLTDDRPVLELDPRGRVLHTRKDGRTCLAEPGGPAQLLDLPARPAQLLDLPARATAAALGPDLAMAIGLETGALLRFTNPSLPPTRHELGAEIFRIDRVPGGHIVATTTGQFLAVPTTGAPVTLASVDPGGKNFTRLKHSAVIPHPHDSTALLLIPEDDAIVAHDFSRNLTRRRPITAAADPHAAYNPDGSLLAVATAGDRLLFLTSLDDPGHELDLHEQAARLAFLDADQLAVWAESGALLRVDTRSDTVVTLTHHGSESNSRHLPGPDGEIFSLSPDPRAHNIPHDPAALAQWLQTRRRTLAAP